MTSYCFGKGEFVFLNITKNVLMKDVSPGELIRSNCERLNLQFNRFLLAER